jgi:hypothetical protein
MLVRLPSYRAALASGNNTARVKGGGESHGTKLAVTEQLIGAIELA